MSRSQLRQTRCVGTTDRPWLAEWAEERFKDETGVRVVSRQQWTPDLVEEIAEAETVLFVDCSLERRGL